MTPMLAVVALVALVVGEAWRMSIPGLVRDAPLSQATVVALALVTSWPSGHTGPASLLGLTGLVLLATVAVLLVAVSRRTVRSVPGDLARLTGSLLVAGVLARLPLRGGSTLLDLATGPQGRQPVVAVLLLVVAVVAVLTPVLARVVHQVARGRTPLRAQLTEDLGRHGPLALATATTATVMALGIDALGPGSLVLFLVPLVVLQPAVSRQRRIRLAQRQTVVALGRLTEEAGLTAAGHSARVADLAVPVARDVGVAEADLLELEDAALLHDIGQVGLSRPIPGGATIEVSGRDQRRIAATGAAILARTAELSRLAAIVADVGVAQHRAEARGDVGLASRVLRVVSAYDDLSGRATRLNGTDAPAQAVERLLRNTPHEYDPVVVDALIRHLERRGVLPTGQAGQARN